jgi:hypothetical protein
VHDQALGAGSFPVEKGLCGGTCRGCRNGRCGHGVKRSPRPGLQPNAAGLRACGPGPEADLIDGGNDPLTVFPGVPRVGSRTPAGAVIAVTGSMPADGAAQRRPSLGRPPIVPARGANGRPSEHRARRWTSTPNLRPTATACRTRLGWAARSIRALLDGRKVASSGWSIKASASRPAKPSSWRSSRRRRPSEIAPPGIIRDLAEAYALLERDLAALVARGLNLEPSLHASMRASAM